MRTGSHNARAGRQKTDSAATRTSLASSLMTGVMVLSGLVGALNGLPAGLTAVVVVVLGLLFAAPKILEVAPRFLSALNERRVTKAIRSEAGALTALRILRPADRYPQPMAADGDVPAPDAIGGSSSESSQSAPAEPGAPPPL